MEAVAPILTMPLSQSYWSCKSKRQSPTARTPRYCFVAPYDAANPPMTQPSCREVFLERGDNQFRRWVMSFVGVIAEPKRNNICQLIGRNGRGDTHWCH